MIFVAQRSQRALHSVIDRESTGNATSKPADLCPIFSWLYDAFLAKDVLLLSYISLRPLYNIICSGSTQVSHANRGYAIARLLAILRNDVNMCTYDIFIYAACGHNSGIRPKTQFQTRARYPVRLHRPNEPTVLVDWRDPCWPQQGVNVQEHQMGRTQRVYESCGNFTFVRKAR